jgi:hypothetical protein
MLNVGVRGVRVPASASPGAWLRCAGERAGSAAGRAERVDFTLHMTPGYRTQKPTPLVRWFMQSGVFGQVRKRETAVRRRAKAMEEWLKMRVERENHPGGLLDRWGARRVLAVALTAAGAMCFMGAADSAATSSSQPAGAARSAAIPRAAQAPPVASAAHVLNVKDEGHLHSVRSSGSELVEEGPVSGTIPGKVKVSFNIGATITAKFTIYANGGGSISGHGGGALHSTSVYSTFGGSLAVTGGSGRYTHAHGNGTLSGAINRKTYALTVQTTGKLYY